MRRTFTFYLCCFAASLVAGAFDTDARAQCDNDCRHRFDFYLCNGGVVSCIHYSGGTCNWCVNGGGCTNGDPVKSGTCQDTFPSPTSVPAYFYTPCKGACKCPGYQTYVEADVTGSDLNPFAANIKVCR